MNEFFLANRQFGGFVSAIMYAATTYSAFMMVGLAGLTYKIGVGALGFEYCRLALCSPDRRFAGNDK
jgi:SSS family solute:Na+ symporter